MCARAAGRAAGVILHRHPVLGETIWSGRGGGGRGGPFSSSSKPKPREPVARATAPK